MDNGILFSTWTNQLRAASVNNQTQQPIPTVKTMDRAVARSLMYKIG